tara:strand:+ start:894 stop:1142 length:249 start_codon:yes stop_codon:yes gene_type:complete
MGDIEKYYLQDVCSCTNGCVTKEQEKKILDKRIWGKVRMQSSLHILSLTTKVINCSNNKEEGVGKKHGSYARYLAKRKSGCF